MKSKTVSEGWVPVEHGNISSYTRGCRCDPCRERNNERQREHGYSARWRIRKYAERVYDERGVLVHPNPGRKGHGTITGYTSYGCRCDECRDAMLGHQRFSRDATPATKRGPRPSSLRPGTESPKIGPQSGVTSEVEMTGVDLGSVFVWDGYAPEGK